jgi:hypothetical protein
MQGVLVNYDFRVLTEVTLLVATRRSLVEVRRDEGVSTPGKTKSQLQVEKLTRFALSRM